MRRRPGFSSRFLFAQMAGDVDLSERGRTAASSVVRPLIGASGVRIAGAVGTALADRLMALRWIAGNG